MADCKFMLLRLCGSSHKLLAILQAKRSDFDVRVIMSFM